MNRLWLWIVIGVGLLAAAFVVVAAIGFLASPLIIPARTILTYEVDPDFLSLHESVNMQSLVAAIDRRLNSGRGWNKLAQVRKLDDRRIEVTLVHRSDGDTERVKRLLEQIGTLEFRILANARDNKELIERAFADPSKMDVRDKAGALAAWWVPVEAGEEQSFAAYPGIAARRRKRANHEIMEILVLKDVYDVTGAYLTGVSCDTDPRTGKPCLSFSFNKTGAQLFGMLTGNHLPDERTGFVFMLAIILNGAIHSAPTIQSTITDRGQITGSFTTQQVQDMANVLNAGSFPARIRLVGKKGPP